MDDSLESKSDSHRHLSKARMMGKLFGREKKPSNNGSNDAEVSAFLHGPSDKLYMNTSAAPPTLLRIDTTQASRWPTAAEISRSIDTSQSRSVSPKRTKKGLIVRFTDSQPEIIGVGGDQADSPTLEISARKRSHPYPPIIQQALPGNLPANGIVYRGAKSATNGIQPAPLRRTQTGREANPEIQLMSGLGQLNKDESGRAIPRQPGVPSEAQLPSHNSFAARVKAEMRAGEGRALRLGSLSSESADGIPPQLTASRSSESSPVAMSVPVEMTSPLPIPRQLTPGHVPEDTNQEHNRPDFDESQVTAAPVGTDVLDEFSNRVQLFFKLFQLSAESVMPLSACTHESLVRAALWWFLRGRAKIESLARLRPSSPEGQQSYTISKQQAHADLAKSLWIVRDVIMERAEIRNLLGEFHSSSSGPSRSKGEEQLANILERSQVLTSSLRKLAISMQRHDCLPPPLDEAPLPQGLDPTIWIKYPALSHDIASLLSSSDNGALGSSSLSEVMPLGDTKRNFDYGSMFVDVFLPEKGIESQVLRCPSILFVLRALNEKNLMITISSQHGMIALSVKSDRLSGPTWNDINWQTRISAIDVTLSTGLVARIQLLPNDFKTLWNMYDYTCKIHAILRPRRDENTVFEKTLQTFQYFDRDPQSRVFPKEPLMRCQMRIFEKRIEDSESAGVSSRYGGLRIAIITGTNTKNLSGISHDILTGKPLQYGYMRGENGTPALLLRFEDGSKKPTMVLTFENIQARSQLHNCVTGGVVGAESVAGHIPITNYVIMDPSQPGNQLGHYALHNLEWQSIRVIEKATSKSLGAGVTGTGMSDNLRVISDSKSAIVTDRINFNPGDLKIRLSTHLTQNEVTILREPQHDMTISISESQVSKEKPQDLAGLLAVVAKSQTIRRYTFPTLEDLHRFQAAVTGFNVLFDGLCETFSVSRRRTVVPISKKWDALLSRLQILSHEMVVQLVVFFNNFSHGECMSFVLKVTDTFETFSRGGKHSLRIGDAKFALPKGGEEDHSGIDKGFICLTSPEYPAEHDDITITFGSEAERDHFAKALPARAKAISKLSTVMR